MKKRNTLLAIFCFVSLIATAQKVGINTNTPLSTLHISGDNDSKLLLENTKPYSAVVDTTSMFFATKANDGNIQYDGAIKTLWYPNPDVANYARMSFFTGPSSTEAGLTEQMTITPYGNVGIGKMPDSKLDVAGTIHSDGYMTAGGSIVSNGYINAGDGLYSQTSLTTQTAANIGTNLTVNGNINTGANSDATIGRNLNIGTNLTVNGNINTGANSDATIGRNLNVGQNILVNTDGTNRGIMSNYTSSPGSQLKYLSTDCAFTAILGPHAISGETSIAWPSGAFTTQPSVTVAQVTYTGGTVGQLYMVDLKLYNCTTNSCKARLVNLSSGSVNYAVTYRVVITGY